MIVDESAKQEVAIPKLIKELGFTTQAKSVSQYSVYVHHRILNEFAKKFSDAAQALQVGDPAKSSTEVGPLIRKKEVDRVAAWVEEALHEVLHSYAVGSAYPILLSL